MDIMTLTAQEGGTINRRTQSVLDYPLLSTLTNISRSLLAFGMSGISVREELDFAWPNTRR